MTLKSIYKGQFTCDVRLIARARSEVVQALQLSGRLTRQGLLDFEIAFGELLQNIVRHETCALPPCHFSIELEFSEMALHVTVSDTCDLLQDLSFLDMKRTATENGGMGIALIKNIATKYSISSNLGINKHSLIFDNFLTPS